MSPEMTDISTVNIKQSPSISFFYKEMDSDSLMFTVEMSHMTIMSDMLCLVILLLCTDDKAITYSQRLSDQVINFLCTQIDATKRWWTDDF